MLIPILCSLFSVLVLAFVVYGSETFFKKKIDGLNYSVSLSTRFIFFSVAFFLFSLTSYHKFEEQINLFESHISIMSKALSQLRHFNINEQTTQTNELYLNLIETEVSWMKSSGNYFDSIYTLRKNKDLKNIFIIAPETDYNKNGVIDNEREERVKIGELYDGQFPELEHTFTDHQFHFTEKPYIDKWGQWISAYIPLYNELNQPEAVLAVDIAVSKLVSSILVTNLFVLIGLFSLNMAIILFKKNQHANILLNESLKVTLRESEKNLKLQRQFTATMSHEIRTPLNAIIGSIQLLDKSNIHNSEYEKINVALQSSRILADIIGDILDYSKIQSDKVTLEKTDLHIPDILKQLNIIFQNQITDKNINFNLHIDDALLTKYFVGDQVRLKQVLVNFVSNAFKFTSQGYISVSVRLLKQKIDSSIIEFRVLDTGIGISVENQKKLFHAFQQADSAITRKYGGSGLGLVIAKNLIEIMGGQVYFDSQLGKGTTIVFTVNFENSKKQFSVSDSNEKIQKFQYNKYNELKILVVDDVQMNRFVLAKTLDKIGFKCDQAQNGEEAVQKNYKEKYDIIFMDCQMPVLDGLAATKLIRTEEANLKSIEINFRPAVIYAITANSTSEDKQNCLAAGMDDFIPKPFTLQQIEKALQFAIQKTENQLEHNKSKAA